MKEEPPPDVLGNNGAISNFIDDIAEAARQSNGFALEIGTGKGTGSTVGIARGLDQHPHRLHISVDAEYQMEWTPDIPGWHFVLGDSMSLDTFNDVAKVSQGRHAGLIFIDTIHDYVHMEAELKLWKHIASDDTVWLFHDTHMFGFPNDDMVNAIKEFAEREGWIYDDFRPEPHGLGRMRAGNLLRSA